jgi:hypothetical protein
MKVKHLVIVGYLSEPPLEVVNGIGYLTERYSKKPGILDVKSYLLDGASEPGKYIDEEETNASVKGDAKHEVGAYFVFHYGPTAYGKLTPKEHKGKTGATSDGYYMAQHFHKYAYKAAGHKHIAKVCLLACKGTVDSQGKPEHDFAEAFVQRLGDLCYADKVKPPLIAGWDSFVTIGYKNNLSLKNAKEEFRNEPGRKVGGVGLTIKETTYNWGKNLAGAHKWVWVWDEAYGKVEKKLASVGGWSDNITAAQTPDNHTALKLE